MKFKNKKCKRVSTKHFSDIRISNKFRATPPKQEKYYLKALNYLINHELDPIVIGKNNVLLDGYCSYLIAKELNYKGRRLKIYKVDTEG